jgi:hypothetical protein
MKKTLRTKSSNINIISFMVILGLFVLSMSGCQQINDMVNSNKATNSNTTANTNANSNSNSNVTANSNANTSVVPSNSAANTNNQASNSATATKEEVPLTEEAKVFKNNLVGSWTNGKETLIFDENKLKVKERASDIHSYQVVNENTVELKRDSDGYPWKATMKIEDDGNTLLWQRESTHIKYTRVKPN